MQTNPFSVTSLAVLGLLLTLAACGDDDDKTPKPKPVAQFAAEIRRTEFGVPHIVAKDEKGLGFGLGYAYAEDNFCSMADTLLTISGERSKYFGAKTSYETGVGAPLNNLASDFFHKFINDDAVVQASWERQSPEAKDLMQGYAAGYNRYLKDIGAAKLPKACNAQAWVREMSTADLMRLHRFFAIDPSLVASLADTLTPPAGEVAVPASTRFGAKHSAVKSEARMGSNGVALGKEATESGAGLLLANPHFPWNGPARFYQMHLTIPGKVDVMGASLSGFPAVNIGFNKDLAWTHTTSESRHNTLYQLTLDPANPARYMVDGQSRAFNMKTVNVEVLEAGVLSKVKKDIPVSDFGFVIASNAGQAYALRDANFENDRMLAQWWAMNKASSLDALKTGVEAIMGNPWAQTIATDKSGRVYYGNVTPVPAFSEARYKACQLNDDVRGAFGALLDGSKASCAWEVDPAAAQKGILPASKLPSLLRTDYVQNSNDSSWMTNAKQPLLGFPAIVSQDSISLSDRTRYGLSQITARLSGTDGRPGNRFSLKQLQEMVLSNQSHTAVKLLADLNRACEGAGNVSLPDGGGSVDISKGCKVLMAWDGKADNGSIGWPLFEQWQDIVKGSGIDFWRVPFDKNDPVNTPRGLRLDDATIKIGVRQALAAAMLNLDAQGLDYLKPWGQIQVATRGDKRIPISGGNRLGDDIYNVVGGLPSSTQPGQLEAFYGSSIVLTVSFEGDSPKAQGFLSYSQSTDPASPYYADQTERFSKKEWISYPFTDAAIKADPKYTSKSISQ